MAVYKLFPSQDTTLYSAYQSMNTGLDSILEIKNEVTESVANPRGTYEVGTTSETQNEEIFSVTTLRSGKQFENPIPPALDKFNPTNPPL